LCAAGLTSATLPPRALLRLLDLWGEPMPPVRLVAVGTRSFLVAELVEPWLRRLRARLRSVGGPVDYTLLDPPAPTDAVAGLLRGVVAGGWLGLATPNPPRVGLGLMVARMLQVAPQTPPNDPRSDALAMGTAPPCASATR